MKQCGLGRMPFPSPNQQCQFVQHSTLHFIRTYLFATKRGKYRGLMDSVKSAAGIQWPRSVKLAVSQWVGEYCWHTTLQCGEQSSALCGLAAVSRMRVYFGRLSLTSLRHQQQGFTFTVACLL